MANQAYKMQSQYTYQNFPSAQHFYNDSKMINRHANQKQIYRSVQVFEPSPNSPEICVPSESPKPGSQE